MCKTRNYKAIIEYFSHEVKDLEPAIFYLNSQKSQDVIFWESKYVVLLWLSIIILVPFDLSTIDSEKGDDIFAQLLDLSKFYLKSSSLTREAAAIFLAKFFSRPDIQKGQYCHDYL